MRKNWGISLLRWILSFVIVLAHFFDFHEGIISNLILFFREATPSFMIIAFYFSAHIVLNGDSILIKKRMYRLMMPQFAWGIVFFFLYNALELGGVKFGFRDLVKQLIFGSPINGVLWFQFDLIILTLLFYYIFKILNENAVIVLAYFSVICLVIQYLGYHMVLSDIVPSIADSIGRLFETFPCATVGIILYKYRLLDYLRAKWKPMIGLLVIIKGVGNLIGGPKYEGYGIAGVNVLIGAICIVCIFYILPLDNIDTWIKNLIDFFSKYSMGVYIIHFPIGLFLNKFIMRSELRMRRGLLFGIVVYGCSLLISFAISCIPLKKCSDLVS